MTQPILEGIPLTAREWQLYVDMPGSTSAAIQIGRALSDALREHLTAEIAFNKQAKLTARRDVHRKVGAVMFTLRDFGATDTEPLGMLEHLVSKAFNWSL